MRTRKTLSNVHVLLGLACATVAGLFGGGWTAMAQVQGIAAKAGADAALHETAGLKEDVASLRGSVASLREDVKEGRAEASDTRTEVRGLRKDLRTLFPALPRVQTDGGL